MQLCEHQCQTKEVEETLAGDGDTPILSHGLCPASDFAALKPEGALVALFKEASSSFFRAVNAKCC